MALEVLTVEYTSPAPEGTDHGTVYATRVTGEFWEDHNGERTEAIGSNGWRVGDTGLWVYPDEVDAYIELLQKIKATKKK